MTPAEEDFNLAIKMMKEATPFRISRCERHKKYWRKPEEPEFYFVVKGPDYKEFGVPCTAPEYCIHTCNILNRVYEMGRQYEKEQHQIPSQNGPSAET